MLVNIDTNSWELFKYLCYNLLQLIRLNIIKNSTDELFVLIFIIITHHGVSLSPCGLTNEDADDEAENEA